MNGKLLLGLGALAGGVWWLKSRSSDEAPGEGAATPGEAPGAYQPGGAEPWGQIPDAILKTYQSIIYGHGTAQDCKDVLAYIDRLEPETQAETDWLASVRDQVTTACNRGAVPVASNPPALPNWIPDWSKNSFDFCWNAAANGEPCPDVQAVVDTMTSIIDNYRGLVPNDQTQQAYNALVALQNRYTGVAGVSNKIPHVGDCGCASCEAKRVGREEESCCEACAMGVGSCACSPTPLQEDQQVYGVGV